VRDGCGQRRRGRLGGVRSGNCRRALDVARAGIEPATFHFSGERYYRLSYLAVPAQRTAWARGGDRLGSLAALATPTGLEPATSAVTGRRANQLRYGALSTQLRTPFGARKL
jgi:hypothetical protein